MTLIGSAVNKLSLQRLWTGEGEEREIVQISAILVKDLQSLNSFILEVIDSTIDICAAYKPNFAFYYQ